MPLVDLPLDQLRNYRGINPKPHDFDSYWDRALAELDATAPEPELVPRNEPSTRSAECFDLFFTGVGGARIYAKYLRPAKRAGKLPAILQFHGYGGSGGDWTEKLGYVAEGFCYAAMDCRGQGGLSEDVGGVKGPTQNGHIIRGLDDPNPDHLLFRQIFLDTVQLGRVVRSLDEVDAGDVSCWGGSQGGALALACAALDPGIRRCVSVFPFLSDYRRVWEMDLAKDAYAELRNFFRSFDPLHAREEEIFTKLGYIDVHHLAPRIRADVLMLITLMDTICPPSTQFAAYNAISSPKRTLIYPDYAHESLPGAPDAIFAHLTRGNLP